MPNPEQIDKVLEKVNTGIDWFVKKWQSSNWKERFTLFAVLWGFFANPPVIATAMKPIVSLDQWNWAWWICFGLVLIGLLVGAFVAAARVPKGVDRKPTPALKWLNSYGAEDAELFQKLQRGRILDACLAFLQADGLRFGILSGESGSGKTSFLQASFGPTLKERGQFCLHVKLSHQDPFTSFLQAVARADFIPETLKTEIKSKKKFRSALDTLLTGLSNLPPTTEEKRKCSAESPVVLIFDQFEQFFALPEATRAEFSKELEHWYNSELKLPLKVLLSIRDDRLGKLTPLQQLMGYTLEPMNNLRLEKFSPEQAELAFIAIAEAAGIECDKFFVKKELIPAMTDREDGRVSPVDLQVLAWVVAQQSDAELRKFHRQAYQRLGGFEGLLETYLRDTMQIRETRERREAAVAVLAALCDFATCQRAGAKTLPELLNDLNKPEAVLNEAVKWLASPGVRLLVPVEDEAFEIIHEKIIPSVQRMAYPFMGPLAKADILLNRRVKEWLGNNRDKRYLFTRSESRLIRTHEPRLTWGQDRQVKEELLKASRQRHRRTTRQALGAAAAVALLAVGGWFAWENPHRIIWQCRQETDQSIEHVTDPVALARTASILDNAGDRPRAMKARERTRFLAEKIFDPDKKRVVWQALAVEWAKTDPKAAAELAKEIIAPAERPWALEAVAMEWSKTNPKAAVELAKEIADPKARSSALRQVAEEWAKTDPKAATECAKEITDVKARSQALRVVAVAWAKTDPKAATECAKEITDPEDRSQALLALALASAKTDPEVAARAFQDAKKSAKEITDAQGRFQILAALEREARLGRSLPDEDQTGELRAKELRIVAIERAKTDPKAAISLFQAAVQSAKEITDARVRSQALRVVAVAWAKTDPKAATECAEEITDPEDRSQALLALALASAKTDPEVAARAFQDAKKSAKEITDPEDRSRALRAVAVEWAKIKPEAAAELADGIPDHLVKAEVLMIAATESGRRGDLQTAESHVQKAVTAVSYVNTSENKSILLRKAGELMAQMRSWQAAYGIARVNSSEEDRLHCLATILYEWSRRDQPLQIAWELKTEDDDSSK